MELKLYCTSPRNHTKDTVDPLLYTEYFYLKGGAGHGGAFRRPRQEDHEFKVSLGYKVKPDEP